jgi:hypothetical protein
MPVATLRLNVRLCEGAETILSIVFKNAVSNTIFMTNGSAKNIVSHIRTEDLKMFIQKRIHYFQFFSFNFDAYCKFGFPVLHRVILHYKFFPVCNT